MHQAQHEQRITSPDQCRLPFNTQPRKGNRLEIENTGDDKEEDCQQAGCQCYLKENAVQLVGGIAWEEEDQYESEHRKVEPIRLTVRFRFAA